MRAEAFEVAFVFAFPGAEQPMPDAPPWGCSFGS